MKTSGRGDATREALLDSAMSTFGEYGYHGVSTRTLSREAGVNLALINYHFGGKQGLYLAVFERIADTISDRLNDTVVGIETALTEAPTRMSRATREERFMPKLLEFCDGMAQLMLDSRSRSWAQLIAREHQTPSAAFDLIYERFFGRVTTLLTRLVSMIRNERNPLLARTLVVGIMGQILVWRMAREGVMRHMQWQDIGAEESDMARRAIAENVRALVMRRGKA